jgi:hypothetical protein
VFRGINKKKVSKLQIMGIEKATRLKIDVLIKNKGLNATCQMRIVGQLITFE